jgi:serine/threonine protein kinase
MAPELSVSTFTGFASTIPGDDLVKSDIFSLGVCLFILVFGFPPFKSTASRDNCQLWKIFNSHRTDLFWKLTFKRAKPVPKELT